MSNKVREILEKTFCFLAPIGSVQDEERLSYKNLDQATADILSWHEQEMEKLAKTSAKFYEDRLNRADIQGLIPSEEELYNFMLKAEEEEFHDNHKVLLNFLAKITRNLIVSKMGGK